MDEAKIIGTVTEEDSASIQSWNSPNFHIRMETECEKFVDAGSVFASTTIEIGLNERSSIKALHVDAQTDEDWEAIKEIGRKIIEVAERSQEKTKALMGDKYNKTSHDQYKERQYKERTEEEG
jgi:hypothetical protein